MLKSTARRLDEARIGQRIVDRTHRPARRTADRRALAGGGAKRHDRVGVGGLDRVLDLDVGVVHFEREAVAPALPLGPSRAPHRADVPAFAGFRLQARCAANEHRQLRIALRIAAIGGHAVGDAIGLTLVGLAMRQQIVAWIVDGRVEARAAAEQFADRGRAEALDPRSRGTAPPRPGASASPPETVESWPKVE